MDLSEDIKFKTDRLDTLILLDYDLSGLDIEKAKDDLLRELATATYFNKKITEQSKQECKDIRKELKNALPSEITEDLSLVQLKKCKKVILNNLMSDDDKNMMYWLIVNYSSHE